MSHRPIRLPTLLLAATLAATGVYTLPLHAQGPPELRVDVTPARVEVVQGARASLTAQAFGPGGDAIAAPEILWTTPDFEIVQVDGNGMVTALSPGLARVSAIIDGVPGFATIVVTEPPPVRLALELPVETLPLGTSAPLSVTAWNAAGQRVGAPVLAYQSTDGSVLRVDPDGRVFAVGQGEATVRAFSGDGQAEVTVSVGASPSGGIVLEPVDAVVRTGDVVRFQATAGGQALFPSWAVGGAGAQIEGEGPDGVFVAEEPGRYRVTAQIGDELARTVSVEVTPREYNSRLIEVGRGVVDSHHTGDMWVFEGVDGRDYAYVGTYMHDWAKIFDVTDPGQPVLTDSIQLDARRINDVKIHDSAEWGILTREGASGRANGIVILDLSTPAHPSILTHYTENLTGGVHNVWIEGDLVYAAHNGTSSIVILDISNPAEPVEVGRFGLEQPPQRTLHDVIVQDGYAYLSYWDDGIIMVDVGAGTHGGTPTEPTVVSRYAYPVGNTHVAWRQGRYLFIGDEIFPPDWDPNEPIHARGYVHVVDYADPENPVEVARYEVPEAGAHNLWAEGDRLYIGYYQAGLRVVDISGELRGDLYAQGREVARITTTDDDAVTPNWPMTWGAQVFKGRIYSSDFNSGLWITQLIERRVVF